LNAHQLSYWRKQFRERRLPIKLRVLPLAAIAQGERRIFYEKAEEGPPADRTGSLGQLPSKSCHLRIYAHKVRTEVTHTFDPDRCEPIQAVAK
jgi:hypothetical protein